MAEILIVDDDHNLRETLREIFLAGGYVVRSAANGAEAIASLANMPADAVLCDWKMPVAGGELLLRTLASDPLLSSTPVIIMTVHGDGPNAMQAMQLGAYDFATKPLGMDEVPATASRAIEHPRLQRKVEQLRTQRFLHRKYPFPGNVRELKHLMDRLAVKASGRMITGHQVAAELSPQPASGDDRHPELAMLERLPLQESVAMGETPGRAGTPGNRRKQIRRRAPPRHSSQAAVRKTATNGYRRVRLALKP